MENAKRALGIDQHEAERLVRESFIRLGRMLMEVLSSPGLDRVNIRQRVKITGCHYLEDALLQGRGVVLATAHTGNWELLGAALAMYGFPIVGVAQKQANPAFDRFINEYRTLSGMQIIYKSGVRDMVRMLEKGKIIGMVMDQDAKERGVFVDFFDRQASTAPGAAALARFRNAPIVPAFIIERDCGVNSIIVHPPVWVTKTGDREKDIRIATQRLSNIIEQHIRLYPAQWLWLHDRWKTRPLIGDPFSWNDLRP